MFVQFFVLASTSAMRVLQLFLRASRGLELVNTLHDVRSRRLNVENVACLVRIIGHCLSAFKLVLGPTCELARLVCSGVGLVRRVFALALFRGGLVRSL